MTDSRTPNALTLSQAAAAIACGELASEDLVRACWATDRGDPCTGCRWR